MKAAAGYAAGFVLCAIAVAMFVTLARSADHQHSPEHAELHDRFYADWMRPDDPRMSCCNKQDCAPAEARIVNGRWQARRASDAAWLSVPDEKIERRRDSPDGRNHLCAAMNGSGLVFCFVAGAGI